MSRPHKATVDYFPHMVNHGKTMFTIESKFGNDGYAFWFKLLEILGNTEQHFINCNNVELWEFVLAKTRINENTANEILSLCSKLGAIDSELWSKKIIRSDNFIENLDSVYKRREVNVLTNADILSLCKQKPISKGITDNENPQSRVEYSRVEYSRVNNSDFAFDNFWDLYDKKVGDKKKVKKIWVSLKQDERDSIIKFIPAYIESFEDNQFQPFPQTFLNQRRWENEFKRKINPIKKDFTTNNMTVMHKLLGELEVETSKILLENE